MIARELLGLFIDDGRLALAIIAWIGAFWLLSRYLLHDAAWSGAVLFAGLGLILIASAASPARR